MQPTNIIEGVWQEGVEVKVQDLRGMAFTEEAGAHKFVISALDADGAETTFSGTVSALFLRADNTTVAIDGAIESGKATVTLVADCYHAAGRYSIAVYISDGTNSACVYAAVGNIFRTTSDVVIDSGATIPTLAQLQAAYADCVEAAEDAQVIFDNFTPDVEDSMEASRDYDPGDLVLINGLLYKITAAVEQGDAFVTGTNIAQTTVRQYLSGTGLASGNGSHAEGAGTEAAGTASHAEGYFTTAGGIASHAEGYGSQANGAYSHAEGQSAFATGANSHAEGLNTSANHKSQHVFGENNLADSSTAAATDRGNYVEIVGNGSNTTHSNARTLDWSGNEALAGSLTLGAGTENAATLTAAQIAQVTDIATVADTKSYLGLT